MTLKTAFQNAQENLETALQIAENTNDSASEHLVAGLIELTKALRAELQGIKAELHTVKEAVRRLR